jgi:hypothetical protein
MILLQRQKWPECGYWLHNLAGFASSVIPVSQSSSLSKRRARPYITRSSTSVTTSRNRIRDIASIVAEVFDGCAITFGHSSADNRSYRTSFDKITSSPPRVPVSIAWRRQLQQVFSYIKVTTEMFSFRSCTRLERLKHLIATGQIDADFHWRPLEDQGGERWAD